MTYEITKERLELLFPAYLEVDSALRLRGIGPAIRRRCQLVQVGDPLDTHFKRIGFPADPELPVAARRGDPIQLRSLVSHMELGGSVIADGDGYLLALNIVPAAFTIEKTDLQMSDFGPSDPTVQGLLLVTLQKAMLQEARTIALDLERERQRSLDLLERVSRAAGYLAHDFNNFLSIIRLNSDRLLAGNELSEAQRRLVSIIQETSERGSEITRSLMTLSHQKNDSCTSINLDRLIADHQAFFATIAGATITLRCELGAPRAMVEVPRTGVLNCLMNLVINARDAMPDGGEIVLSTDVRTVELAPPRPDLPSGPRAYVAIEVCDTGTGMTDDVLKRAFEPFFSTKSRGSGIGLASVMEFAREMGGAACLDSRAGAGAAVYMYIPVSSLGGNPATDHPAAVPENSGGGARVLVVEDEPYALEALVEMLEGDGYRVSPAATAAEAMALLERQRHDVLLTDVVMPEASGLDLADWASRRQPGIHIVMMSGYVPSNEELRDEWRFIRKPLDIALLREMLHTALHEAPPALTG